MPNSRIEHHLSYHIRVLLPYVVSERLSLRFAYAFSLIAAVAAGFASLISLYSPAWQDKLGYTLKEVNTIASMTTLGMYLTPPLLGYIADRHGPITLNFLALLGFVPCYWYLSYGFTHSELLGHNLNFQLTVLCFVVVGISTSSLYFSSLLACAKLHPDRKLLSISIPTTCYGLSSLLGSQLSTIHWFCDPESGFLNLERVFKTLSVTYLVVGGLAWLGTAVLVRHIGSDNEESMETEPLLSNSEVDKPSVRQFFTDIRAYLMALAMLLALGPFEMFIVNMVSISTLLTAPGMPVVPSSQLLSYFSLFSTLTRLAVGLVTDFLASKRLPSLAGTLVPLLILGIFIQGVMASTTAVSMTVISALAGSITGGLYTAFPTAALALWGSQLFGTAYGSLMVAPALGSSASFMLYALVYDNHCSETASSTCIAPVFLTTTAQLVLALILVVIVLRKRSVKPSLD